MEVGINSKQLGDFGVNFREGNKGDTFLVRVPRPVRRDRASHHELCVAGSKRIVRAPEGSAEWPIIKAGDDSSTRPDLLAGDYVTEFLEDGSKDIHVCAFNPRVSLDFQTSVVKVEPGSVFRVNKGSAIGLFGEIELDNGETRSGLIRFLARTRDVVFTAKSRVIGLAIWS